MVLEQRPVVLEGQGDPDLAGIAGALDQRLAAPAPELLRRRLMVAQVGEHRAEPVRRGIGLPGRGQPAGDPGRADHRAGLVGQRDLVGDVPHGAAVRVDDQLDPVDDPAAGQNGFIVDVELIRQEGRREVVVRLADRVGPLGSRTMPFVEGVIDEEGPIDPGIPAVAILDPGEDIVQPVEESGQLEQVPRAVSFDVGTSSNAPMDDGPWKLASRHRARSLERHIRARLQKRFRGL